MKFSLFIHSGRPNVCSVQRKNSLTTEGSVATFVACRISKISKAPRLSDIEMVLGVPKVSKCVKRSITSVKRYGGKENREDGNGNIK
ncbi:hypothetical protein J6590_038264 [Homalodisca vitripennis]|nr:hypothetical protein J6590_038264 [Homalodisca vitripennis]